LFEGPTVTIPRRTDLPFADNPQVQRQKVLADLPHLGDGLVAARTQFTPDPAPRKKKSSHPAFAELAESFDQEPISVSTKRKKRRFDDQPHIETEQTVEERQQPRRQKGAPRAQQIERRQPAQRKQYQQQTPRGKRTNQRAPWGTFLAAAQSHLAPLSGLITTAALIAAAGLMFVIMNNRQPPIANVDEFALPGFRVETKPSEQITSEATPPLVEAEVAPDAMESTADETLPTESALDNTNAMADDPVIEQFVEQEPQLGTLSFPVTTTPLALDYSKAASSPDPNLLQLPVVAERPETQGTEPINR
jgi:hypothetical protein